MSNENSLPEIEETVRMSGRLYTLGSKYEGAIVGARKFGYFPKVNKVDFGCVDDQTEIRTRTGWIPVHQYDGRSEILTWNVENDQAQWQVPSKWNVYEYDGDLISIDNQYTDSLVTPTHRCYFRKWRSKDPSHYHIERADSLPSAPEFPLSSYLEADPSKVPVDFYPMRRIIPWILTEGNLYSNVAIIYQSNQANPDNVKLIDSIITDYAPKDEIHRSTKSATGRGHEVEWHLRRGTFIDLRDAMNEQSGRIPEWIYYMSLDDRLTFIEDMLKGDGSVRGGRFSATYVSKDKSLLDDLQLLCHTSGLRATISLQKEDTRTGAKYYFLYMTEAQTTKMCPNSRRPTHANLFPRVAYTGKVYCPTVRNGTFYARRNNKISLQGNSMYPSSIRTWNLGPDTTKITNVGHYTGDYTFSRSDGRLLIDVPDANFQKNVQITIDMSRTGFLKAEIERLAAERSKLKKLMKETEDKAKETAYDGRQQAIKVIMNSIYGYMGSQYATFGDMATGMAVTAMCRWTSGIVIEELGDSIINIDTDGFTVDRDIDPEVINKKIADRIKEIHGCDSYMTLELEPMMDGYFYKMKNYVVRERHKGKVITVKHGVAMKSSRYAPIYEKVIDELAQKTMDREVGNQFETAQELRDLSNYSLSDFKYRITFSKSLKAYGEDKLSMQRALGMQVEQRLKTKVEKDLQVEYYVTKSPAPLPELQALYDEKKKTKGPFYTISQYVKSVDQLDPSYYLKQVDKAMSIFNWDKEEQTELPLND